MAGSPVNLGNLHRRDPTHNFWLAWQPVRVLVRQMDPYQLELSPPQRMAVAYARRELRMGFALLLAFDNRLKAIAARGQEPLLKQMRLAWWREQLCKPAVHRPKGEPLLAALIALHSEQPDSAPKLEAAIGVLIDAWDRIVDGIDSEIGEAARLRSEAIFGSYAGWVRVSEATMVDAVELGSIWALIDFGREGAELAATLPRSLKPLNLLLIARAVETCPSGFARMLGAIRMNLYALTGL
jgi:hypothetical protein